MQGTGGVKGKYQPAAPQQEYQRIECEKRKIQAYLAAVYAKAYQYNL